MANSRPEKEAFSMTERRKEKRIKEVNRVSIEYLAEIPVEELKRSSSALMEDLSFRGVRLLSETAFPVGKVLKVGLTFAENPEPIHLIAKVKWTKKIDDEVHEMGLETVDIFKETIRTLMGHLYGK